MSKPTGKTLRRAVSDMTAFGTARCVLLLAAIFLIGMETRSVSAQNMVTLPQLVLEPKHTEYVFTKNPGTPNIVNVKSSNPSVATATTYRVNRVQIVAVAPGKTDVEFFDTTQRILYQVSVWVEKSNPTGGGGAGYDPGKTQLNQAVMLVKHTQNVTVPGGGNHQLSSVVSSNPSVATARTNTSNTIQIYSVALGDTFVDFSDNATGTKYQVHVWVVKNLSDPIGGGGSPGGRPSPGPKLTKPNLPGGSGAFDRCLIGTWRSESAHTGSSTRGGSGILLSIKGDGQTTIDYSGMQALEDLGGPPEKQEVFATHRWSGEATGHITTNNGLVTVSSVEKSKLSGKQTTRSGTRPLGPGGLGPVFTERAKPPGPSILKYACSETSLTIKEVVQDTRMWDANFKREKKEP